MCDAPHTLLLPLCVAAEFDLDCVGSGANDEETIQHYAEVGTCQCCDVDNCPTYAQNCMCPTGLFRICTVCSNNFGIDSTTGELCKRGGGTEDCTQIASFSCPPVLCEEWGCSCFDTVTRNGTFGQAFSADKNTGTATCWVDEGVDQCNMGDVSEDESKRCRERGESV